MTEVLSRRFVEPPVTAVLPTSPWMVGDVFGVAVVNLVGLALLLVGLQGTRHTTDPHTLLLFMNAAAAGLVVSLAGNAVFLLSTLRHVGELRTELLGARAATAPEPGTRPARGPEKLVSSPSMTRFHRAGCPAVQGKKVTSATLMKHVAAGRVACDLCAPTTERQP